MQKAITTALLLTSLSLAANASPALAANGCDAACGNNIRAMFAAGNLAYSLHFDSSVPARVRLTLSTRDRSDFTPVQYVGSVDAGLHHANLTNIHFPNPTVDPCEGLIAVTDHVGGNAQTYLVPVHNVQCNG
jgi:hypothetical protein